MSIYEDPISQTVALSLIPADELRQKATIDGECNDYELAKELLNWFHGFFTWVNQPRCEKCEVDSISGLFYYSNYAANDIFKYFPYRRYQHTIG